MPLDCQDLCNVRVHFTIRRPIRATSASISRMAPHSYQSRGECPTLKAADSCTVGPSSATLRRVSPHPLMNSTNGLNPFIIFTTSATKALPPPFDNSSTCFLSIRLLTDKYGNRVSSKSLTR